MSKCQDKAFFVSVYYLFGALIIPRNDDGSSQLLLCKKMNLLDNTINTVFCFGWNWSEFGYMNVQLCPSFQIYLSTRWLSFVECVSIGLSDEVQSVQVHLVLFGVKKSLNIFIAFYGSICLLCFGRYFTDHLSILRLFCFEVVQNSRYMWLQLWSFDKLSSLAPV